MTPGARRAAAIAVLDAILAGQPAEKALLGWSRGARYAGAGDRAAVRDHVFDALRRRRSLAALGGAETGRGLMLGALRAAGQDPAEVFSGAGHAPPPLTPAEAAHLARPPQMPPLVALDCPDWLAPALRDSLGAEFAAVMAALQARAALFLRINLARGTRAAAQTALAAEGIETRPSPLAPTALEVTAGRRRVQRSAAYASGLVELQDAASQAVVEALQPAPGARVLDLCAGGGGKALALAARSRARIFAHDIDPRRMADLPARAARAGADITLLRDPAAAAPYALVLADVPCSGSGSWRRDPEGKWRLTAARLAELQQRQRAILDRAAALTAADGQLAYATCSLLAAENEASVAAFLQDAPGWRLRTSRRWSPLQGGDGFFLALLQRG